MRGDEIAAMVFGVSLIGGVVAMWSIYHTRKRTTQEARLEVMKRALENPTVDEQTKAELLRLLTEEHRQAQRPFLHQFGGIVGIARIALMAVGWITFLISGSMLVFYYFGAWNYLRYEPLAIACVLGFAAMTLPAALRELVRRGPAAEAKQ